MCEKKITSPLSIEEIKLIDATGLPMVDRHHLRLLAHCLSFFKASSTSKSTSSGDFPSKQERLKWLIDQPALSNEEAFFNSAKTYFVKLYHLYFRRLV